MSETLWGWRHTALIVLAFLAGVGLPAALATLQSLAASAAGAKDALQAIQALVMSVAVVVGGVWFLRRRQTHPRLVLSQQVTHRSIAPARIWVRVTVVAENKGNVLVRISKAKTFLQQVVPPTGPIADRIRANQNPVEASKTEIDWQCLAECVADPPRVELEPGETDSIAWDFIISERPKTIIAYSHLPNERKRRHGAPGWSVQTVYDLSTSTQLNPLTENGHGAENHHRGAEKLDGNGTRHEPEHAAAGSEADAVVHRRDRHGTEEREEDAASGRR